MTPYVRCHCPRCGARYRIPRPWLGTRHICAVCKMLRFPQAGYAVILVEDAE